MKLQAPTLSPTLQLIDIEGQPVVIGAGRKTLLSLFREASCPFCNFRVYELTHNYQGFSTLGLDIVAVFVSSPEEVRRFIARQPRPFRMVADPNANAHRTFGGESSLWGKLKATIVRLPAMFRGMAAARMRGGFTGNLMPADFLIDETGRIVETWYGRDAGDHIPIERLEMFVARGIAALPARKDKT